MNISEDEKGIEVTAEMPGIDDKDIEVSLKNDILTIKGEKKQENEEKNKDYYRAERSFGSFQRSIQLPSEVEADKIKASFKKGILKVELPKSNQARESVKRIEVKSA